MQSLRLFVRLLLEEEKSKTSPEEELLTEPDETEGRPEKEISAGGVPGVTVPLGASSAHYPSSKVKKNSKNG